MPTYIFDEDDPGIARIEFGDKVIELDIIMAFHQSGLIAMEAESEYPVDGITDEEQLNILKTHQTTVFYPKWISYIESVSGIRVSTELSMAIYDVIKGAYDDIKKKPSTE